MDCMYSNQECSSGCESGWTLYLEHSSISPYASYNQEKDEFRKIEVAKRSADEEDDDEDLSMVSDASSGPPHLHEEEGSNNNNNNNNNGCFYHYPIIDDPLCKKGKKNRDKKRRRNAQGQQSSLLDDTASSPFFDSSDKSLNLTRGQAPLAENNDLEYSQGYSSTQFEVRPPYQEQYGLFQPANQPQQKQWFEGKRW